MSKTASTRLLAPTDGVFEPDTLTILLVGEADIDKRALATRLRAQPDAHVDVRMVSALPLPQDGERPAVDFVCFMVGGARRRGAIAVAPCPIATGERRRHRRCCHQCLHPTTHSHPANP